MIITDLLAPLEELDPRTQDDELPQGITADVYSLEDDPLIPPFSPDD